MARNTQLKPKLPENIPARIKTWDWRREAILGKGAPICGSHRRGPIGAFSPLLHFHQVLHYLLSLSLPPLSLDGMIPNKFLFLNRKREHGQ